MTMIRTMRSRADAPTAWRLLPVVALPLLLAACGSLNVPRTQATPRPLAEQVTAQWQAPLPHGGSLGALDQWWQSWQDPLLAELVSAAQRVSPTLSAARSQLEQARATRQTAAAALLPTLDGSTSITRGTAQFPRPLNTTRLFGLETAWEADLFDGNQFAERAAAQRLQGAQAQWHDARVSVAADVALQYIALRHCERQRALAQDELASLQESARLIAQAAAAGLVAPTSAAAAQAAAAESAARLSQQRAQCEVDIKTLVALTGITEAALRERLGARTPAAVAWPTPALPALSQVPLQVISQRPDVFAAERDIVAARADIGTAQALRLPRLSLAGSITALGTRVGDSAFNLNAWSIGPLRLRLPLFDGGTGQANVQAALARHEDAVTQYEARVRQAVREVEEALVQIDAVAQRMQQAREAAQAHARVLQAVTARQRAGLASRIDVEEARRATLLAESTLTALQRESVAAAVALYRASGGGWRPESNTAPAAQR